MSADVPDQDRGAAEPERREFATVVARWRLTQSEVASVLGLDLAGASIELVLPADLDAKARDRMRLLAVVDRGLSAILGAAAAVRWLRSPAAAYDGLSPLDAIADDANLRALASLVTNPPSDDVGDAPAAYIP